MFNAYGTKSPIRGAPRLLDRPAGSTLILYVPFTGIIAGFGLYTGDENSPASIAFLIASFSSAIPSLILSFSGSIASSLFGLKY